MPTDEQLRNDFIVYLRQLKLTWFIKRDVEIAIIKVILCHKDSELKTYIAYFKNMIWKMTNNIYIQPDKYSKDAPVDGKCVDSFVGISVNTQNYASNYALRLSFSETAREIYKFEVLC